MAKEFELVATETFFLKLLYLIIALLLMLSQVRLKALKCFETMKSILSKIVPAPNLISLKLLNDSVAGILIINTNILAINATDLR